MLTVQLIDRFSVFSHTYIVYPSGTTRDTKKFFTILYLKHTLQLELGISLKLLRGLYKRRGCENLLTTKLTIDLINYSLSDCNMAQRSLENLKSTGKEEKEHFIAETAKFVQLIAEQEDKVLIHNECCKAIS